ncbi:hypothetical protein [Allorhodopirellula solitaria]|uniref:Uncharacterized protein n=1 Tax=Allorhodopirellula solitaria TaxID=2527987 RepID=A0A5C5YJP7_9BACT|nr:hypothetical protein [Allorhodopirellula solitaria]TWT75047.1 hypothetical protein CA85_03350 [Allorhodopirellula solitaria]
MNEASASSVKNSDTASSSGGSTAGGLSSRGSGGGSRGSLSNSQWLKISSSVHLGRSQQTWTGAGSAAGYVLRYLTPMRRLMVDVTGGEKEADRALAILVTHLVRAGFSGHDRGRLRDFLVRGIRSAAKARFDESVQQNETAELESSTAEAPVPPKIDRAKLESPKWLGYWRDGILQRSWRSLERYQHARRYEQAAPTESIEGEPLREDYIHDVLQIAMAHPKDNPKGWAGRLSPLGDRRASPDEVVTQLELARIRFAQYVADEVAQTLEVPQPDLIEAEIKSLGLSKAFMGVKVET